MNAVASEVHSSARLLDNALIRQCGWTEAVVQDILRHQAGGESFVEAALRLGHARPEDVDKASAACRRVVLVEKRALRLSEELSSVHDPFDPRAEKIRALRTELLLRPDSSGKANAVAVLSPCAGEGRSRLVAELAIAFAQLGQSTLLIDADFRRPRQQTLFGSDNREGLSQAIGSSDNPYMQPVEGLPHLSVLTAGPVPSNPLELLSDGRFGRLLDDLSCRYDHIVVDTPPADGTSDALSIATLVGRVLLLNRAHRTPYKSTRELLRRLGGARAQVLGAVINHF